MESKIVNGLPMENLDEAGSFSNYVESLNLNELKSWALSKSPRGGRGLFASRNLEEGALIFQEHPLIIGPRIDPEMFICVGCHHLSSKRMCSKNCGAVMCSEECESAAIHRTECALLGKVKNCSERERLALISAIRSFALLTNGRNVVKWLERHERSEHDIILSHVRDFISGDEYEMARCTLQAMDATAFLVPCAGGGSGSLRGLYPLTGMLNHECSPNTRHCYDTSGRVYVETTKAVPCGDEFTISYTSLIWGNQARQKHLLLTKRFECKCNRCLDPQEFGAQLMALHCMKKDCGKVLLPLKPGLNVPWGCSHCGNVKSASKMEIIVTMVRNSLQKLGTNDLKVLSKFLRNNHMIPATNESCIELKLKLVSAFGHDNGFLWSDLSLEDLELKRLSCIELLAVMTTLRLGKSRQRGKIILELIATLNELKKRGCENPESLVCKMLPQYYSADDLYNEAVEILRYDSTATIFTQVKKNN